MDNDTPSIVSPFSKLDDKVPELVVAALQDSFICNPCLIVSTYAFILCWLATAVAEFEDILSSSLKSMSVAVSEPLNIGILFALLVKPAKAVNSLSYAWTSEPILNPNAVRASEALVEPVPPKDTGTLPAVISWSDTER